MTMPICFPVKYNKFDLLTNHFDHFKDLDQKKKDLYFLGLIVS